jgi:hypothetical protein
MNDWQPVIELECLLDALEAELLSASDEAISDALGRRHPARMAALAISDAALTPDTTGWPPSVNNLHALDPPTPLAFRPRARADH